MNDPRHEELARTIVGYSLALQPGERVLIEAMDIPPEMVVALLRAVDAAGGVPLVSTKQNLVLRELYRGATEASMRAAAQYEATRMRGVQAYVGLRGGRNASEFADVAPDKLRLLRTYWQGPVHLEIRVPQTRWVVLRYPDPSMAQQADMSSEAFEDFFFRVCTLDYRRLEQAMEPLARLMEATDRVRVSGPGTDLRLSIRGIGVVRCRGRRNLPDGEVFSAPVRDSVEGEIAFNVRTIYQGAILDRVRLRFRQGRVVEAEADRPERLLAILDQDEGSRHVGEFALSFNPHITRPMLDILFDEKMAGACHLALGNAYGEADNGNRSSVHWDLILQQTAEAGGGKIWFDDRLIREDGRFVLPELQGLNPENLA